LSRVAEGGWKPVPGVRGTDLADLSSHSVEFRTELLLKRADLTDALEAAEVPHRRRKRLGLAVLVICVIALILGFTSNTRWLLYAFYALQIPFFGLGFFLLAGQEVRRLRRDVEAVDKELRLLGGEKAPDAAGKSRRR
jgi:hypothetical protein